MRSTNYNVCACVASFVSFWFAFVRFDGQSDAKGPRPDPLGQLDREGKEANAYDKMNALSLARMEVGGDCHISCAVYLPTVLFFILFICSEKPGNVWLF